MQCVYACVLARLNSRLLALASPEIEILGYVITFGNTDPEAGYLNILKLYAALHRHFELFPEEAARFPNFGKGNRPFLVYGASKPLAGELVNAKYFHGRDGLSNISLSHPDLTPLLPEANKYLETPDIGGPRITLDTLSKYPANTVTYCAIGPMTTLAMTRRLSAENSTLPSFDSLIGRVVVMGGALDVPGNTTPLAEFNVMADSFAARDMVNSSLTKERNKFQLLPLDLTTRHQLRWSLYRKHVDSAFGTGVKTGKTPLTTFTSACLEGLARIMAGFGAEHMELHDPVALWFALTHPPTSSRQKDWQFSRREFDIETTGILTNGMCVVDRRGSDEPGSNRAINGEIVAKSAENSASGAEIVVETPGSTVIEGMLLERIWGCNLEAE